MTDRIILVTPPDDTLLQGIRILHVDLTEEYSSVVSNALIQTDIPHTVINYIWKMGNPVTWLLDKSPKCDIILFNANCTLDAGRDVIIGWISAQPQSYYFGNLKDLNHVNNHAIYTSDDVLNLMEKVGKRYD